MISSLEWQFEQLWVELYPDIELWAEQRLIPGRGYRFDFVHFDARVAIEIQGQIWVKGRHNTGTGLISSYQKLNLANSRGWQVFQLSEELITEQWLKLIADTITNKTIGARMTSVKTE
jgi:very-short-patch-repair endonuclease